MHTAPAVTMESKDGDPDDPQPSTSAAAGARIQVDENHNVVEKEEDKPKGKSSLLAIIKGHGQVPKTWQRFNVFAFDFARMFGYKRNKKSVRFPDEVIQKALDKGETSPDGNSIPLSMFPYRATYSRKKSQVVRVVRGTEFRPKLAWIKDTTLCEVRCEKFVTSCKCLGEYQDPKAVLKAKRKNKQKNQTKKLTKLTESFMFHVNIAESFLVEHKTRTLLSALQDVDGLIERPAIQPDPTTAPMEVDISSMDADFYVDELPPLSQSRMGKLATNVWLFGNCVPLLFGSTDYPTEPSYRRLMGDFAGLALSAYEGSRQVIQQSKDFHNYAKETMRVIRNLQLKIYLQGDTSTKEPIMMGGGLQLQRKANPTSRPGFEIFVAKVTGDEGEVLHFQPFKSLGSTGKMVALRNLLTSSLYEFDHAKHQIDFLVDDIKETTYDSKLDSDLLYQLSEMYHCIIAINSKIQADPTDTKNVQELKVICETMSKFVLSLNSFISASEHIMEKIMEVRDMIQLTYTYLQQEMKIDLSKLMPPDHPIRFATRSSVHFMFTSGGAGKLCFGGGKKKRKKGGFEQPKYRSADFHRVYYEDNFDEVDMITDGFVFRVKANDKTIEEPICPKIRFRHSDPGHLYKQQGSNISVESLDSLTGLPTSGDKSEKSAKGSSAEPEEPTLKPILKNAEDPPINPPGTLTISEKLEEDGDVGEKGKEKEKKPEN